MPRIFNKIYDRIQAKLSEVTGCKKWLVDRAVATKLYYLEQSGAVTHCCYDRLVFKPIRQILGGNVRTMATGSAPLETNVQNFLKIAFSCPI